MLRVTQVLEPFLGLDRIPRHLLDAAADRGTRVHRAIDGILKGMPPLHIEDDIHGYLKSYEAFELGKTVLAEHRITNEQLGLTGQIDLITRRANGELWIVDYKTSSKPSKAWPLQLSAYYRLAVEEGLLITGAAVLHLQRDGSSAVWLPQPSVWPLYESCLEAYKYFFKTKKEELEANDWEHI